MTQEVEGNPKLRRRVEADLIESTPWALGYWLLASPMLIFLAWIWVDLFAHYSPLPWYWLDGVIGVVVFVLVVVLPAGVAAHRFVTAFPRLFQNAGWDVQPLEPVAAGELYMVRYVYQARRRAANSWGRMWLRAAQGWVYLEILAIFAGAILMIPIFLSVSQFGFGQIPAP